MFNGQHVSIEIKGLADSFKRKFETSNLPPHSKECCIYRIPRELRKLHERQCTPGTVSIGPFHYDREELKAMEDHKIACLKSFLKRTKVNIEDFLTYIKDKEAGLRECYAENITLESDEFVKMILVDAAFLFEFLLEPILSFKYADILSDIWMLENQLPLFILDGLFELARVEISPTFYGTELSFLDVTCYYIKGQFSFLLLEENVIREQYSNAKHFFDLLRLCLKPPSHRPSENKKPATLSIPTVRELYQAGVKFELGSTKHLFDIRFENGVLKIPKLNIFTPTEPAYRNLLAFELYKGETFYLNDYILLVSHLVNTRKDVELLIQNGVTEHWLWDTEDEATIFQRFVKDTVWNPGNFYYSNLVEQLNDYCKTPWNKWKAILKQNYFNTPWASISVIAAAILLILTFIQTMCSIVAL